MNIESELKKNGIQIVEKLDTLFVNSIASNISTKICDTFPQFKLDKNTLFAKLSRLNMYRAKMPEGMAEANYFYKNTSIYFNEHIPKENIEEFAIHECIHCLQEVKDNNNDLIRMGLCDYTQFKTFGLGLNEAAVQLMSSKIADIQKEDVKYFGINFQTNSPSYYPLECCLVNQLAYLVGENVLFESTLMSTNSFFNAIYSYISPKAFLKIQSGIDNILNIEEKIIKLNNKIYNIEDRNNKVDSIVKKIDELKNEIRINFFKTQNLIVSSYFNTALNYVVTTEQVEFYRKKLYKIQDVLGNTENYTFFNNYYLEKMAELEHKYNVIENGGIETSLYVKTKKQSKFIRILKAIKKIILEKPDGATSLDNNF